MTQLAVVRDLREYRPPASAEELEDFEVDVLSGFVLARSSAGLADGTIRGEVGRLERVREWFERALWEMEPADADAYFGRAMHGVPSGTRLAHSQALRIYFEFLELRHKVEIHAMTGRVVECPIDDMNRPRGSKDAKLRIPPRADEMAELFSGWAQEYRFVPEVRAECPQLHRCEADGRAGTTGERGPLSGPGRHQVGAGPVRQAACPSRQGTRLGPARANGAVDQ